MATLPEHWITLYLFPDIQAQQSDQELHQYYVCPMPVLDHPFTSMNSPELTHSTIIVHNGKA